jgi:CheY-like chemotaxis protein
MEAARGRGVRAVLALPVPAGRARTSRRGGEGAAIPQRREVEAARTGRCPAAEETIRLLLADDHRTVRVGLKTFLQAQSGFEVVDQADNGKQAVACVRRSRPDVVLMDVNMPIMDGVEATRIIKERWPNVRVVGLSMYEDPGAAERMRAAGADDYVTKSAPSERLLEAIRACTGKSRPASQ